MAARRILIANGENQEWSRWAQVARVTAAALFVVLTLTYAVRSALVTAFVTVAVQQAASIWKNHPDVLATLSRLEIAEVAAQNKSVSPEATKRLAELAKRAPLSPEPFFVAGAVAISEGRYSKAEQLLLAARYRVPRSAPVRYLLADLYWREDRVGPALQELAAVRRLVPRISAPLVAGLADYIRRQGAIPQVRAVLGTDQQLQAAVLSALAANHTNADLILSLVGSQGRSEVAAPWVQQLSISLINAGEFRKAHKLWLRFASPDDLRAARWEFVRGESSSPFTWQFIENSGGSAVPTGGRLDVFYSGRESINFASKLVLLPPGSYEISMLIFGTAPSNDSIRWSVACLPSDTKVADVPVMKIGRLGAQFRIPQSCVAQKIELRGFAQNFPETGNLSISELRVTRKQVQ